MIKVIKQGYGVEDGEIYPRTFRIGETLSGALAESAVIEGWAREDNPEKKPSTNKALSGAPRNKQFSSSPVDQASQKKMWKKRKG